MADDITLTVNVRDRTRADFERLHAQLERMKQDLRGISTQSGGTSEHLQRIERDLGKVQDRAQRLHQTGTLTSREFTHMRQTLSLLSRESLQAVRAGDLTRDQYNQLRTVIGRTRLDFDTLSREVTANRTVMRSAADDAERLRQSQERLRQSAQRLQMQDERLRQSAQRLAQSTAGGGGGSATRTLTVRVRDMSTAALNRIDGSLRRMQSRVLGFGRTAERSFVSIGDGVDRFGSRLRILGGRDYFTRLHGALDGVEQRLYRASQAGGRLRGVFAAGSTVVGRFMNGVDHMGRGVQSTFRGLARGADGVAGGFRGIARGVRGLFRGVGGQMTAVRNLVRGVGDGVTSVMTSITSSISKHPVMWTAIVGIFYLIIALAPAVAAALSVVIGGAFVALGAYALKADKQVSGAFDNLKNVAKSTLAEAAKPMKTFLVDGLNSAAKALVALKPAFKDAFAAAGPLIQPIVEALANFIGRLLPGVTAAMKKMGPAFQGFATAMGSIGDGLGKMFENLAVDPQELKATWEAIGQGISDVLSKFGQFLGQATQSGTAINALKGLFAAIGFVIDTMRVLIAISDLFWGKLIGGAEALISKIPGMSSTFGQLRDLIGGSGKAAGEASPNFWNFGSAVAGVANSAINQATSIGSLITQIQNLNDTVRSTLDAESAFEQAIDDAAKAATDNANQLKFRNGQLDLGTQKSRDAYKYLSTLSQQTQAYTKQLIDQKAPWSEVIGKIKEGHKAFVDAAVGMGATGTQAEALAKQLIDIPNKKVQIQGNIEDLQNKIAAARKKMAQANTLKAKAQIRATIDDLTTKLAKARADLDALNGKTAHTYVVTTYKGVFAKTSSDKNADGVPDSIAAPKASGGLIQGPGSDTSDDVPIMASNNEYVVRASSVRKYGRGFMDALNRGTLRAFARGGSVTKAEAAARRGAAGQFSVSHFGRMVGYKRPQFQSSFAAPGSLDNLASTLNKWSSIIKAATHGGVEKNLLKKLDQAGVKLTKYEKAHEKVTAALDAAKTKLQNLKDAAAQLSDSVKQGIVSNGGIMTAGQNTASATGAGGLVQQMSVNANAAANFAAMLAKLKKMGLNGQSLSEIAQAGVDEGSDIASRLINASPQQISQINSLESQLQKSAGSAGSTAADAMYGAGIKAAQGVVDGLAKQKKHLEKLMSDVANALAKTLKKALGIKASGGAVGGIGAAATGGARGALTMVGEHGPEVVRLPFGSQVRSNPDTRRILGAPAMRRGDVFQVNLMLDGKVAARALVDPLRGEIRHISGGNVQKALGRGNG